MSLRLKIILSLVAIAAICITALCLMEIHPLVILFIILISLSPIIFFPLFHR